MLLMAGHDALLATGCAQAFLFTHERNERALAFYALAGYRPDGSIRETDFRAPRCAKYDWSSSSSNERLDRQRHRGADRP